MQLLDVLIDRIVPQAGSKELLGHVTREVFAWG